MDIEERLKQQQLPARVETTTSMSTTLNDIERMAYMFAKSNLFGVKTVEQAAALMLIAHAEGMHPAIAARDYDIIQGRPAKKTEAMLRDFLKSGGRVEWHALTDELAEASFSHPAGGIVRISWDLKRAGKAGIGGKDNWKKYPRQMLRSRVVSEGVRTVCPAATSGMYCEEEVQDFDDKRNNSVVSQMPYVEVSEVPKKSDAPVVAGETNIMASVADQLASGVPVAASVTTEPQKIDASKVYQAFAPYNIGPADLLKKFNVKSVEDLNQSQVEELYAIHEQLTDGVAKDVLFPPIQKLSIVETLGKQPASRAKKNQESSEKKDPGEAITAIDAPMNISETTVPPQDMNSQESSSASSPESKPIPRLIF